MFATPPAPGAPSAADVPAAPVGQPHALFRYGGRRFALPISAVQEVIGELEITPLPRAGAGWLGIGNLRGEIVPAATLGPWFSATAPATSVARAGVIFLILTTSQGKLALAADGFENVTAIPPGAAEPPSADGSDGPDFVSARWQPPGDRGAAVRCLDAALLAERLRIRAAASDSSETTDSYQPAYV